MTQTYRTILKRVGWSLILFGLLDISMMIYRGEDSVNSMSNILSLGVIAGIFLLRGNLQVTAWVTWFSAFYWVYFVSSNIIQVIVSNPLGLWITRFHLQPIFMIASGLFTGAIMIYLPWVYHQLRQLQSLTARVKSGLEAAPPISAWGSGAGLALVLGIFTYFALTSNDAAEALKRAERQLGPDYNYQLSAIIWSGASVDATVTAYNRHTIQSIDVEWTK